MNENPINPGPSLNNNPYPAQPVQPAQGQGYTPPATAPAPAEQTNPYALPLANSAQTIATQPGPSLTPGPQIIYPTSMQQSGTAQPVVTALPTPSVSQAPIYKAAEPIPVPAPSTMPMQAAQAPQAPLPQPVPVPTPAQNPYPVQPQATTAAPAIQPPPPAQPATSSLAPDLKITSSQTMNPQSPDLVALGLTQPAAQPVIYGGYNPPVLEPKQKNSKKTALLISLISVVILLVGGAAGFYFLYWTKSSVVYSRSQKQFSNIFTSTLSAESKLFNDMELSAEVSAENTKAPIIAKISSRILDSGSESAAEIDINKTVFNIGLMTTNNTDKTTGVYLKYKSIEKVFKAAQESFKDSTSGTSVVSSFQPYIDVLKKYDDKWISINIFGLITGDEKAKNETITQEDYDQVIKIITPIINSSLIGLDKAKAVFKTTNIRSEKVAGKSAWAYDIEIDNKKFNAMIDDLKSSIDKTTLSDNKKKTLKDGLESRKLEDTNSFEALPEASQSTESTGTTATTEENQTDVATEETSSSVTVTTNNQQQTDTAMQYVSATKTTIWLEKLTALPIKFSVKDTTTYNGKLIYSNEQSAEITKLTKSIINGSISLITADYDTTGKETSNSTAKAKFVVDNKESKLTLDGNFDPASTASNDLITYKLTLKPNTNKSEITTPANPIDYSKIYDELSKVAQSLEGAGLSQ